MWANCRQDKEKPHSEKDLKYLDYEKKKSFQKQKEHIMLRKKNVFDPSDDSYNFSVYWKNLQKQEFVFQHYIRH